MIEHCYAFIQDTFKRMIVDIRGRTPFHIIRTHLNAYVDVAINGDELV